MWKLENIIIIIFMFNVAFCRLHFHLNEIQIILRRVNRAYRKNMEKQDLCKLIWNLVKGRYCQLTIFRQRFLSRNDLLLRFFCQNAFTGSGYGCLIVAIHVQINCFWYYKPKMREKMRTAHLFFAAAALSLCLRFLNQFPTCVGVSPVACASSLFLLGFG